MSSKVDAGFEIKDPDPEILPVLPSSHRDGGIRREIDSNDNCDEKPTISAPELKPVPFMSLFRYVVMCCIYHTGLTLVQIRHQTRSSIKRSRLSRGGGKWFCFGMHVINIRTGG